MTGHSETGAPDALRLSGYHEAVGREAVGREAIGSSQRRASEAGDANAAGVRSEELEFTSRGDRVTARVTLPPTGAGPFPLLLVLRDPSEACRNWDRGFAERGLAVASVDLPLHGSRSDAKLRGCLPGGGETLSPPLRDALAEELARQAVIDAERALDALSSREWIDPERVAVWGLGLGAQMAAAFCALDPRPRAAVLAWPVACLGPETLAATRYLGRFAPRPLLVVGDGLEAEALFDASAEAHELLPEAEPTARAGDDIWNFLARVLQLTS